MEKHFSPLEEHIAGSSPKEQRELSFFSDVALTLSVRLGTRAIAIRDLLGLQPGAVLELSSAPNDPFDLCINGKVVARGEVVVVNDRFGLRITEVLGRLDE